MRLLPAILLSVAILLAPVLWYVIPILFFAEDDFSGPAIDSGARIEIEMLSQRLEDVQLRLEDMRKEMQNISSQQFAAPPSRTPQDFTQPDPSDTFTQNGPNDIVDAYAQVVLIANRRKVNRDLTIAGPSFLAQTFGLPRNNLGTTCQSMTNSRLKSKLVLEDVGPIRVNMLKPAVESLRRVFNNVRVTDPDLYARISTAGSLCVRLIRGSANRASTHAYGLAVDLNIDGFLDTLGDGKTQLGLTILADFFRDEGWIWGAAWSREDSMHFEVSRQKLLEWIDKGLL